MLLGLIVTLLAMLARELFSVLHKLLLVLQEFFSKLSSQGMFRLGVIDECNESRDNWKDNKISKRLLRLLLMTHLDLSSLLASSFRRRRWASRLGPSRRCSDDKS